MHAVHGTFKVKEGMLRLDVAPGKISGRIELEVRVAGTIRQDRRERFGRNPHTRRAAAALGFGRSSPCSFRIG